ncbi:MAG TPA: hypothetical protein VIG44_00665 [Thermomicrobiales bacterium]
MTKPENGATTTASYSDIAKVEAIDKTTAKVTFKAVAAAWFIPFVADAGEILPKHALEKCASATQCESRTKEG